MRTLIYYVSFWGYLLFSALFILWMGILRLLGRSQQIPAYASRRAIGWGRTMVRLSGGDIQFEGAENIPSEGGFVVCSNHQGAFDIPLVVGFLPRPIGFVAKIELGRIPLLGYWMKQIGCLFLDRKNPRQGLAVMREGIALLKGGAGLVVFPEGTRSGSDTMGPFRQGSLRMAVSAGVPVVPVTIIDSHKLREAQGWRIRPASVRVVISPPIETQGMDRDTKKALLGEVREIMAASLARGVGSAEAGSA
ncbi:MAG: 1-acyl-sn-glycerol-3-phosphate acyltransferase [Lentisphaerae bacterium]|jgi:1-acyl-sn-glycerol-3-phosphate acyltransferase|nr:1-acyl-sn-glycerol-3-phosphate acyltransferase [Lentisphaerota bacterium]MBT4818030.1 1-acyl-sn-glycerol-3-phosphate acyltransferase [Lentisphaerota bacterium]MBT5607597.1 1-acyl-sn-glycerol-3-phosphate acyltransferase [Lentisphaerota bacterium]MBT7845218.1 1-acyl-sn-glycerol-3-phosphate acyltransferase [Lentisphaerota bacterium]